VLPPRLAPFAVTEIELMYRSPNEISTDDSKLISDAQQEELLVDQPGEANVALMPPVSDVPAKLAVTVEPAGLPKLPPGAHG
jgi:hypothetical protein